MKLASRIIVLLTALIFLIGLLTITFTAPIIKQGFREMDHEWTRALSASIAEGIAKDTINGNATQVFQILNAVVLKNQELEYAYVVDFDNRIFAHSFKQGFPKKLLKLAIGNADKYSTQENMRISGENHEVNLKDIRLDGKKIEEISYPIINGMSARLHLGLSEETDNQLLYKINEKLIATVFVLGFLGIMIALPLSRQLTKPLEQLGVLMQNYGSNKINDQISIPQGSEEIIKLSKTFNDMVVERNKIERELDEHRTNLEELVAERTNALHDAQDELVRKERLATLGQLTATVSHELRNPLGAMRPSLFVIEKKCNNEGERVTAAIERIDRNISRCDRIIDEVLDFTRITELEIEETYLDQWLASVIDEQVIPEGVSVEKNLNLKDARVLVDISRLRRAIINVFENACHSMMDDNQKVVNVDSANITIETNSNEKYLNIVIADNGKGMPKKVLEKIFEPLFSTKGFGVGLGMPTIKQIMQQHQGDVVVDSEEGKGTRVTLCLPISSMARDKR